MSDFFREQTEIIQQFGWAVVHVLPSDEDPADTVPFAYTVGLTATNRPELIIAGLPPDLAHQLLNELAGRVHDEGARYRHGRRLSDVIVDQDVVILAGGPTTTLWPGAALARYGREKVRLQQMVWPDPGNLFPWQRGYDPADYAQPLIDAPSATLVRCHAPRSLAGPRGRRSGTRRGRTTP